MIRDEGLLHVPIHSEVLPTYHSPVRSRAVWILVSEASMAHCKLMREKMGYRVFAYVENFIVAPSPPGVV